MWPKAFAQLVELAPHISRLLPMADRFFQTKATAEDVNRSAIESVGESLRGDLGQVTAAHASLSQQINTLTHQMSSVAERVSGIASDAAGARMAAESLDHRLARLEARQSRILLFLAASLALLLATLILLALLYARAH